MITREHDRDARLADAHGGQRRELGERIARGGQAIGQADVELAARDRGEHVLARSHLNRDVEPRPPPAERRQRQRQPGRARGQRGRAHDEGRPRRLGHPRDVGSGRVKAEQQRLGVLEQARARLGRRHRAAVEQRDLQVAFQRGYLLGDGRLGVAELDRGGREGAQPGHGDEGPKQLRFHPISIAYRSTRNHRWRLTRRRGHHGRMTHPMARIALVGDRSANVRAHARIPTVIDALLRRDGIALDAYWIATPDVAACDLGRFDAIWLVPGSPYDERRRGHRRGAHRPRAPDSVPRDVRRLPVRPAGIRAQRLRAARRRERGGRPGGRRAPDRAARVLAEGPRGGGHDRAGHARREDIRPGAADRALPLRLRPERGLPGSTVPGAGCGSAASTTAGRSGSRSFPGIRSSSERSSSPNSTATAPSRTRSSSPWPQRRPSTPPRRPTRPPRPARPGG